MFLHVIKTFVCFRYDFETIITENSVILISDHFGSDQIVAD